MISVILPAYNSEKTIESSIRSVLNQTYTNFELIVVLNGCSDNTEDIAKTISKSDNRIKIHHSEKGIVPALNTGLRYASGDIIARQDADDEWYKFKLEKQIEQFNNCDILGTQIDISSSGIINQSNYPLDHSGCVNWLLNSQNPIAHPSVIFKRSILDKIGGYWDLFPFAEDMDFWLRCIPFFKLKNADFIGMKYNHVHNPKYNSTVPIIVSRHYRSLYGVK